MLRCTTLALLLGLAGAAQAAVSYPTLNQSFMYPASPGADITNNVGPVALDPAQGVFTNTGNGGYDPAATRYYGGVFHYTPGSDDPGQAAWAGGITITFKTGVDNENLVVGKPGGQGNWVLVGRTNTTVNSGVFASGDVPFIVKVETFVGGWNIAHASLFVGSQATAATEGASSGTVELVSNSPLTSATIDSYGAGWAPKASAAATTGIFSSTTWTPVVVPEPSGLAFASLALAGLIRRRKA